MKKLKFILPLLLIGCVGEDIEFDEVDPVIQIVNPISTLEVNTFYQFEYMFLDNVGSPVDPATITWTSSDASLLTVDDNGLARGIDNGTVTVSVSAMLNEFAADTSITFDITGDPTAMMTERSGTIATTTSYVLQGAFELEQTGSDLTLEFESNYIADDGLPGLYIYLTNNPNSIAGALEIGKVSVFTGAHSYTIPNTGLFDYNYVFYYCKPFNVKVGDGLIQ